MALNLNVEQQDAIACRDGAWLWLATAGSGKTTVLTERVKRLFMSGEPITEVLALTFTKEAAENMSERIGLSNKANDRYGFKTFHSFGLRVLTAEKAYLPWLKDNSHESLFGMKIVREILRSHGYGMDKRKFDEARRVFSKVKRNSIQLPDTFEREIFVKGEDEFRTLYPEYNRIMRERGQIDYDDMLVLAVQLLENPEIRKRYQFKWVLCDEGQDTDNLQFRMLQLISERDKNVFVVGDINQSMYGFRGSKPDNLTEEKFTRWFPGARIRILPENFRSTPEIVEFGRSIAPIKNDLVKNMRTANPSGLQIEVIGYDSTTEEVDNVLSLVQDGDPGKSAILARTNQQIGFFETECTQRSIKFYLLGKSGFWKTGEIKNITNLVAFVLSGDAAETYPQRLVAGLRGRIEHIPAADALTRIVDFAKLRDLYANEDFEDADNYALENINTVIQMASRFPNLDEFNKFSIRASHASRKSKHAVTLGTIHAAKGLEWDNVYVIGVQEGKMPHNNSSDHEEEQRILYVAVSRPCKKLQISYVGSISRFLEEEYGEHEDDGRANE